MKAAGRPDTGSVSDALGEIADLLEVQGGNPYRIRAYRTAARVAADLSPDVLRDAARLDGLRGIGGDLAGKIVQIASTGTCEQLEELRRVVPPALLELLHVPGIGPHRAMALRDALALQSVEDLRDAAAQGRLRQVRGFGEQLQQRVLDTVRARLDKRTRVPLERALPVAAGLLRDLAAMRGVLQVFEAGSLRRRQATVGDIDLLAIARTGADITRRFAAHPAVRNVLARGATRASVVLREGLQVDLRVVEPACAGSAWVYFTGSKAHGIALRRLARARGLKLSEYGLFRNTRRIAGATEEQVYGALGLDWIAPELREDMGEVEAAQSHALPVLVARQDVLGDLRVHTQDGQGRSSLAAMARAAREIGLAWMGVSDVAGPGRGIDPQGLARQAAAIAALRAADPGITLLQGVEVDILPSGSLALPDRAMERLDFVAGCLRGGWDLPREQQTQRLLRALDNPHLRILGATRASRCDVDWARVVQRARERGCHLELEPGCLQLDAPGCRQAREGGVLVNLTAGAREPADFPRLDHAVFQARRGWLERADVLNALPLESVRERLARRTPVAPRRSATAA